MPQTLPFQSLSVARLSGALHTEDLRARDFATQKSAEWLRAAGATRVATMAGRPGPGPSGGQHQAGTCRMGDDPAKSVTDPFGRVWGHDNLRIADGSLHVTNGGVNPVLTIYANALRVIDLMVTGKADRSPRQQRGRTSGLKIRQILLSTRQRPRSSAG